ncbi:MAG TPA: PLP-dependent aminotransferase family protein [Actinocrinis sp.]|nr:PLP-dependent aminotransferase family protein [Actinocrinis sp.]
MWSDTRPVVEMPRLFERGGDLVNFAGGLPDLTVLPLEAISAQLARLVKLGGRIAFQYSTPHVAGALVPAIADLMEREGARAVAENLVPTNGSQMGLTAVGLGLGAPGETILCQSPAYPGAAAAFRTAGLELHAAGEDEQGMSAEGLRETVLRLRAQGRTVRLLYTNPTFQNPTGATLPVPRRAAILDVCRELDVLIIEDNPYGLLSFDGTCTTAFHGLDPEQVVYLGTFSKIFAPGMRCGWIAAPAPAAAALRRTTEVLALSPSALAQAALAAFHAKSGWSDLIGAYRESYRERCDLMCAALERELGPDSPWRWDRPGGGFYVWLRHRDGVDTGKFLEAAAAHGVSYVPGVHFSIAGEHAHGLRLCFSFAPRARIDEGVARLAAALSSSDWDGAR